MGQVQSLRRTTGDLLACAWTFTCTTWSLCVTCWSRWPRATGSLFMVFLFILLKKFQVMIESRKRRSRIERLSHLGLHVCPHRKSKRWNGTLEKRWNGYLKLKGPIFLTMYAQTAAMDAQQATDLLGRTMDLSSAATTAAQHYAAELWWWWRQRWFLVWRWSQSVEATLLTL